MEYRHIAVVREGDLDCDAAYGYAGRVMAEASRAAEVRENMRAFLEKRRPNLGRG